MSIGRGSVYSLLAAVGAIGIVSLGTALIIGADKAFKSREEKVASPAKVYPMLGDLNKDGIPEIVVVDANGHRTPFYSYKDGTSVTYLPSSEMARLMPDLRIDYDGIEREVNTNSPFD